MIHLILYFIKCKKKYMCFNDIYRANSLKRAIRRLVEHTETAVDEQNNPSDEKQGDKISPNIAIISNSSPINIMTSKFFLYLQR